MVGDIERHTHIERVGLEPRFMRSESWFHLRPLCNFVTVAPAFLPTDKLRTGDAQVNISSGQQVHTLIHPSHVR